MRARPFFAGLAAGLLIAMIPAWLLRPGRGGPAPDPLGRAVDVDAPVTDEQLAVEIARLRAELAALRSLSSRRPVDAHADHGGAAGPAEASASSATDADTVPMPADLPALLAELELQIRSGVLAQRYANDPVELRAFLVQNWMSVGHPTEALALLRGLEPPNDALNYARSVGDALRKQGDPALAAQAFLLALRASPNDWNVVQRVMDTAPGAALAQLQALNASDELGPDARAQRALLLLASGDREAGLEAFDALIASGEAPTTAYYYLVQRDPAAAEARLRQYLESNQENTEWFEGQLADALHQQGRVADAIAQVESMLQQRPEDLDAVQRLGRYDRERALRFLEQRMAATPTPELYGAYAEQLLSAGRKEDAITAYWQAWDSSGDSGWASRLLKLAPDRVAPQLIQRAGANNDDELFGDIADALWRAGQQVRARQLWERAHEIDRGDSEWTNKLAKVARGADPFR